MGFDIAKLIIFTTCFQLFELELYNLNGDVSLKLYFLGFY